MAQTVQPAQILSTPTKVSQAQPATVVQQTPQQQPQQQQQQQQQTQALGQAQVHTISV